MLRRTAVVLPVLVAVPVLLLTACGAPAAPPGSTVRTPSPSGTPTAAPSGGPVTGLAQARAAWAASAASTGEYQLRVVRSCFCAPLGIQTQVRAGTVVEENVYRPDDLGASVSPSAEPSFPRTVEDLFQVLADASDAARVAVTYSSAGVPLRIDVDPIENAADDEFGYAVVFSTMEGEPAPAAPDGTWRPEDPSGPPPGLDSAGLPSSGSVAYVDRTGSAPVLRLGLWGSGSCPDRPVTLRQGTVQDGVVAVTVDVDGTQPPDTACTADYGPTWYAAPLPAALDDLLAPAGQDAPLVRLVLETVGGSTGSTGSSARTVDVLR